MFMRMQDFIKKAGRRVHRTSDLTKSCLVGLALVFCFSFVVFAVNACGDNSFEIQQGSTDATSSSEENSTSGKEDSFYVHVGGAVRNPGVYRIGEDGRVIDVIELAGGFTDDAYTDGVNLARLVKDGEHIIVPTKEEYASGLAGGSGSGLTGGKVNINTANSATLQTLTGVGEKMAERIIKYREANGDFAVIEDLKNVQGIGDKNFEAIKDDICV